ncbi:MAG: TatD family hydrolase [Nitrososphaerota archaeon]|nr:TatD family hydrolase [Nitrososphaerota archaeon]
MRFVDSHVHLSDYTGASSILKFATATQMHLFACSTDEGSSRRTVEIARQNPELVSAFVGVHPSEAQTHPGVGWFQGLLVDASGAGEIGLDPKYSDVGAGSPQRNVFREQLEKVEAAGKPVQVHSRNAEDVCLDELGTHRLPSVLLHWFSGESELGRAEQGGYYISFGPALLESRKLQRMAAKYSEDLVLVESDGPVPFASLGGADGPLLAPSVVFKLAEVKGVSFEEMAETTTRNASAYLPAPGKVKPTTESGS